MTCDLSSLRENHGSYERAAYVHVANMHTQGKEMEGMSDGTSTVPLSTKVLIRTWIQLNNCSQLIFVIEGRWLQLLAEEHITDTLTAA